MINGKIIMNTISSEKLSASLISPLLTCILSFFSCANFEYLDAMPHQELLIRDKIIAAKVETSTDSQTITK